MLKISALKLLMVTDVQMYITNSVDNITLLYSPTDTEPQLL